MKVTLSNNLSSISRLIICYLWSLMICINVISFRIIIVLCSGTKRVNCVCIHIFCDLPSLRIGCKIFMLALHIVCLHISMIVDYLLIPTVLKRSWSLAWCLTNSLRRAVYFCKGMSLVIQELQVVRAMIPLVWFIVRSWPWISIEVLFKPRFETKLQVLVHNFWLEHWAEVLLVLIKVGTWSNELIGLVSLDRSNPRQFLYFWLSEFVSLFCVQNKVVWSTTLELSIGNCFLVVILILASSRILLAVD